MDLAVALVVHVLHGSPVDILIVLAHHTVDPNDLGIRVLRPHIVQQTLGIVQHRFLGCAIGFVVGAKVDDDHIVRIPGPIPRRSAVVEGQLVDILMHLAGAAGFLGYHAQLGVQLPPGDRRIGPVAVVTFDLIGKAGRIAVFAVYTKARRDGITDCQDMQLAVVRLRCIRRTGKPDMTDGQRAESCRGSRGHLHRVLALGKSAYQSDLTAAGRDLDTDRVSAVNDHIDIAAVDVIDHAGVVGTHSDHMDIAGKRTGDLKAGAGPVHLKSIVQKGCMTQHLELALLSKLTECYAVHLIPAGDLSGFVQPITENGIEVSVGIQRRIIEIAAVPVGDRQRIIHQNSTVGCDHTQLQRRADRLGIDRGIALGKGGIVPCVPCRWRTVLHQIAAAVIQVISAAGKQQGRLAGISVTGITDRCTGLIRAER